VSIETEHNGHKITYSENEDVWRCWQLDMDGKTLSALKQKINQHDASMRRIKPTVAWAVRSWGGPEKVTLTLIADDKEVWAVDEEGRRQKRAFKDLRADTPETLAAFAEYQHFTKLERDYGKLAKAALDKLKPLTRAALAAMAIPVEQK